MKGKWFWFCYKRSKVQEEDGATIEYRCCFKKSIVAGTWFERSRLSIKKVSILVKLYLGNSYDSKQVADILEVNKNILTDWTNFIKEVCSDYLRMNGTMIGGDSKIVEIDETKFGRRKYRRGRN